MLLENCNWHIMLPWGLSSKRDYLNVLHWLLNKKNQNLLVEKVEINYYMYLRDLKSLLVWAPHVSNDFAVLIFPVDHPIYWAVLLQSIKICASSRE